MKKWNYWLQQTWIFTRQNKIQKVLKTCFSEGKLMKQFGKPLFLRGRVQIMASHFANCKVNSSYCNCKVVNHTKMWSSFSPKEIYFIHITFSHIISKLYPHFTVCCIAFFIRNIVHIQNCITKCTKCFSILIKMLCLWQAKILVALGIFIGK